MSVNVQYLPLYLNQTLPLVSQQCHYVSSNVLVNDQVLIKDMPRYYEYCKCIHTSVLMCNYNGCFMKHDVPKILVNYFTKSYIKTYTIRPYARIDIVHVAAMLGHLKTLQYTLLHYKLNIDARDIYNKTILMHVCMYYRMFNNRLEIVKYLVENGADVTATDGHKDVIFGAFNGSDADVLDYLLEHHPDPQGIVNTRFQDSHTMLTVACRQTHRKLRNSLDTVKCLLKYGADIDMVTAYNTTALFEACMDSAPIEIIQCIVEHSKDPVALVNRVINHKTILWIACNNNNGCIVKYLTTSIKGIDIDSIGPDGNTPLIEACKHNNVCTMAYLINYGANVNAVNNNGDTPLMMACEHKLPLTKIQYLVEKGANITAINNSKCTALSIAAKHNLDDIVKYLHNQLKK